MTLTCLTVPPNGAGISMLALSDSSVISESSAAIVSPSETSTSMISTSSKSPMSGTGMSFVSLMASSGPWVAFLMDYTKATTDEHR